MAKKELQDRADELGIPYKAKTTVAQLTELIATAEEPRRFSPVDSEGRCKHCGRPGGSNHVHTRIGR